MTVINTPAPKAHTKVQVLINLQTVHCATQNNVCWRCIANFIAIYPNLWGISHYELYTKDQSTEIAQIFLLWFFCWDIIIQWSEYQSQRRKKMEQYVPKLWGHYTNLFLTGFQQLHHWSHFPNSITCPCNPYAQMPIHWLYTGLQLKYRWKTFLPYKKGFKHITFALNMCPLTHY